jgi:hypothetical protein
MKYTYYIVWSVLWRSAFWQKPYGENEALPGQKYMEFHREWIEDPDFLTLRIRPEKNVSAYVNAREEGDDQGLKDAYLGHFNQLTGLFEPFHRNVQTSGIKSKCA